MRRRFVVEAANGQIVAEGGVDDQDRVWWQADALPLAIKHQIEEDLIDRGLHQGALPGYQWLEIDETTVIRRLRRVN